ncbi:MAG: sugar transferase, partial [Chloroflexi bacterium]|nr:sugar transferase [Chloroflexota bacterium]
MDLHQDVVGQSVVVAFSGRYRSRKSGLGPIKDSRQEWFVSVPKARLESWLKMASEVRTPVFNLEQTRERHSRPATTLALVMALVLTDLLAISCGLWGAYLIRFHSGIPIFDQVEPIFPIYRSIFIYLPFVSLLIFICFGLYNFGSIFGGTEEYSKIFYASTCTMMIMIVAGFINTKLIIARGWLLTAWIATIFSVTLGRFLLRRFVYALRRRGHLVKNAIVVGANEEALAIAEQLAASPTAGLRLVGFLDNERPLNTELRAGLPPVMGSIDDLERLVRYKEVREIILVSSAISREQLLEIFQRFGTSKDVSIRLTSGLYEIITTGVRVKEFGYVPLLSIDQVRLTGLDAFLKACLDYSIALVGLILATPLLLLIALLVKISSPGPVLYRRRVLGLGGETFDAYKFRTMVVNADELLAQNPVWKQEYEQNFKLRNDPRVTRIGAILRKASLDELPQLLNVLRGEMSLVGPRMITPEEHKRYHKWGMNLLTVKPGITGLWQVSGRADIPYQERVLLDMHYIRNYSIWMDIRLLLQTVKVVLKN